MTRYTEEQLIGSIEKNYGFKKELIKDPKLCGLWHIKFEVNGICYYGSIAFAGALPTLSVAGYKTEHFYKDTPVTDEYFNEYIKGHPMRIIRYVDPEAGDWEDTGKRCSTQEEAKAYIDTLDNAAEYGYDICD